MAGEAGSKAAASVASSKASRSGSKSSTSTEVSAIGSPFGVGVELDPPGAAHGVRLQRHVGAVAAEAAVGEDGAQELDAVRPVDDERERQVADGAGAVVTDERGKVDHFARPVDAALRRQEHVERAGSRAAADAAVGEVEGGAGEVDEAVVVAGLGDDQLRRHAAGATRQPRCEVRAAGGVGGGLRRAPRC